MTPTLIGVPVGAVAAPGADVAAGAGALVAAAVVGLAAAAGAVVGAAAGALVGAGGAAVGLEQAAITHATVPATSATRLRIRIEVIIVDPLPDNF
jgi:hypothetical protein